MKKKIVFEASAFSDFNDWEKQDRKLYKKIVELIKDIEHNSFKGLGKPEALKHNLQGYWSRRINSEHRLVYKVTNEEIIILSCKYHYK